MARKVGKRQGAKPVRNWRMSRVVAGRAGRDHLGGAKDLKLRFLEIPAGCSRNDIPRGFETRRVGSWLEVEVALDKFAKLFAVFVLHVHELDAVAFGTDVADDGREMNLAEAGADFELNGITDG